MKSFFTNLANEALENMRGSKISQTIYISGRSGSGKTETIKHILNYLCNTVDNRIEQKILNSNSIYEAFGNASTAENNNSSRFFKLIKVSIFK